MSGSSQRQRSTSATRRRAARRRQSSTADETEQTTTIHGLSSIFIWILATSSLVVVITPSTSNHIRSTSYEPVTSFGKLFRESESHSIKMNGQYNDMYQGEMNNMKQEPFFPAPARRGLRFRDDAGMMQYMQAQQQQYNYQINPIVVEQQSYTGASTSNQQSTSEYSEPGLIDMDLIDILWRSDIAVEKGTQQVAPAEQYESDLQTLTEKSIVQVLSPADNARFEEMSKNYYREFFRPQMFVKTEQQSVEKMTPPAEETPRNGTPNFSDHDYADLLDAVSSDDSSFNKMFSNENDASLSDALFYSPANLTEMQELHDSCNQVNVTASSVISSSQAETLFNQTDSVTREQWEMSSVRPEDVFPTSNYLYIGMQNDSSQQVVSNGQISYDHAYSGSSPLSPLNLGSSNNGRQQQTQTSPSSATVTATPTQRFDPYHLSRHSFSDSNTDSSSPCSRLSSESPRYNSESSSIHESRFYGKLAPSRESRFDRSRSPTGIKIPRIMPMGNGQRKRGRQSKDEQLANEHSLPVTAHQISEMSLSELQHVLKTEGLSEYQRQLIRKIRRRGKNKVAARTCRQRRTDRHDKMMYN